MAARAGLVTVVGLTWLARGALGSPAVNQLASFPRVPIAPPGPAEITVRGTLESVEVGTGRLALRITEVTPAGGPTQAVSGRGVVLLGLRGRGARLLGLAERDLDLATLARGRMVRVGLAREPRGELWSLRSLAVNGADGRETPWARLVGSQVPLYTERTAGGHVVLPMVFPILGPVRWHDTFLQARRDGYHVGQDIAGPKMLPLLAAFDGVVYLLRATRTHPAATLILVGDNGWQALYSHLNDDTPGTNDNARLPDSMFAPVIDHGTRVSRGELVGWLGDSGNATGPHLHFEIRRSDTGDVYNAAPSLRAAARLGQPWLFSVADHLRPRAGQVRVEGFLRTVDPRRNVISLARRARTEAGRTIPASQPGRAWVRTPTPNARVLGAERLTVPLVDLSAGAYVITVGKLAGATFVAEGTCAETFGFVADAGLQRTLARFVR